jgi:hypothetical protein
LILLRCGSDALPVNGGNLCDKANLFRTNQELLAAPEYQCKSLVPSGAFQQFVNALNDAPFTVDLQSCEGLRALANEFGFDSLSEQCRPPANRRLSNKFILENQGKFLKQVTLHQKSSPKLASLYRKMANAWKSGEKHSQLKYMMKLCAYAQEQEIDIDESYASARMTEMIVEFVKRDDDLRIVAIGFLANVFRQTTPFLLGEFSEVGIIELLTVWKWLDVPELAHVTFACLANIAVDSRPARDAVAAVAPPDRVMSAVWSTTDKVQKAALKLLCAYSRFPVDLEFVELVIVNVDRSIGYRPALIRRLVVALDMVAETPEGCTGIVQGMRELPRTEETVVDRLLGLTDRKILVATVGLITKMVSHGAITEPRGFFSCDVLLKFFGGEEGEDLQLLVLNLTADLAIVSALMRRFLIRDDVLPVIIDQFERGIGIRTEALFILTNLVRGGDAEALAACAKKEIIGAFVDAVATEEVEVVSAVLSALARMRRTGMLEMERRTKQLFEECNGPDAVSSLMESDDPEVAEFAQLFYDMFLGGGRHGFRFE